ncbi:protein ALP1-like [Phragmites australis]|uniref:protein ALP1-like n=1 Tax=Phragmites australis TaxID=29695 RepID=UPI002D76B0C5|nr:protein ALP1-like [Phragmites australis]
MPPLRGAKRRRKAAAEKKATAMAAAAAAAAGADGGAPADWWDGFCIRMAGTLSSTKDAQRFESVFKMPRRTFNYVCSLVKDEMMVRSSSYTFLDGTMLSLEDRVAVALRRLNSGGSLVTVGSSIGVNHSTVSLITWRFIEAMEERGSHHLRWPSSGEMEKIKSKFEKIYGLPNCCGVVDTTHITMCLSSAEPNCKVWLDHEKNYSMVLQAVVDPDTRFTDIVTGWPGSMKESSILHSSGLFKLCEKGERLNGSKLKVSDGSEIGEYIIGDSGYPLLPWLLPPYQEKDFTELKAEFNRRHSAARTVAPRTLAKFKGTWKFLQGEMWRPDKHKLPRIIHVCCLLHNIIIDLQDAAMDEAHTWSEHDVNYRQQVCQLADENGIMVRDKLSQHILTSRVAREEADEGCRS